MAKQQELPVKKWTIRFKIHINILKNFDQSHQRNERKKMDVKLTPEMQETLRAAKQAVAECNHEYVGTEHILMGMARSPTMVEIFERLGTTGEKIQQEIKRFVASGPEKLDIPDPRLSPRAKLALEQAMQRAKKEGRTEANEVDVLITLYEDVECHTFQILWDLGISQNDIAALTHA